VRLRTASRWRTHCSRHCKRSAAPWAGEYVFGGPKRCIGRIARTPINSGIGTFCNVLRLALHLIGVLAGMTGNGA
jgi:hypothetical protein